MKQKRLIANNKKARHDYFIDETYENTFKQLLRVVAVPAKPYVTLDSGFRNQPEVSRIDGLVLIIRKHPVIVFPEKQVTSMPVRPLGRLARARSDQAGRRKGRGQHHPKSAGPRCAK